jgi:hypothetical protein
MRTGPPSPSSTNYPRLILHILSPESGFLGLMKWVGDDAIIRPLCRLVNLLLAHPFIACWTPYPRDEAASLYIVCHRSLRRNDID